VLLSMSLKREEENVRKNDDSSWRGRRVKKRVQRGGRDGACFDGRSGRDLSLPVDNAHPLKGVGLIQMRHVSK
jgi:hypothetical protein